MPVLKDEDLKPHQRRMAEDDSFDKSGKGTVTYNQCPCCGNVIWRASNKEPEDRLIVELHDEDSIEQCRHCQFVLQRNPEIFNWVVAVVQQQIAKSSNPQ